MNMVVILDDGVNGLDSNVVNNVVSDLMFFNVLLVLLLIKDDGGVIVVYGMFVVYLFDYGNMGNQMVIGVVFMEIVLVNIMFNVVVSLLFLWSCVDGSVVGIECMFDLGMFLVGVSGMVKFGVDVDFVIFEGIVLMNVVSVFDDGSGVLGNLVGDSDGDMMLVCVLCVIKMLFSVVMVMVGEEVFYCIEVLIFEGVNMLVVVLMDFLLLGFIVVCQDVVLVGVGFVISGLMMLMIEDDSFVWSFGMVSNSDVNVGIDEVFIFDIMVQVKNDVLVMDGVMLLNDVMFIFGGQSCSDFVDVFVVELLFIVDKSFDEMLVGGLEMVMVCFQFFYDVVLMVVVYDVVLSDVFDVNLMWVGNVVLVNGLLFVVDISVFLEVWFILSLFDFSYDDVNCWEMMFEVMMVVMFDVLQCVDNVVEVFWILFGGVVFGECMGDVNGLGGVFNDYVVESVVQFNNGVCYIFEDFKNDVILVNDFDYNDLVFDVVIIEQVNVQGEWIEIELWIDVCVCGVGFVYDFFFDVGIEGFVNIMVDYYNIVGIFLFSDLLLSNDDFVKLILIFFDLWFVLLVWNLGFYIFLVNMDLVQLSGNQIDGVWI